MAGVGAFEPVPGGEPELVGVGNEEVEEAACVAGQILGSEGHLVEDARDIGVHHRVEKLVLVAEVGIDQRPVCLGRGFDAVDPGTGDPVGSELVGRGLEEPGLGGLCIADLWCAERLEHDGSVSYNYLFS